MTVTALEARRLRLLIGKPLAEVDRLWKLESAEGTDPTRAVPWKRVGEPVDYEKLELRERVAALEGIIEELRNWVPNDVERAEENAEAPKQ